MHNILITLQKTQKFEQQKPHKSLCYQELASQPAPLFMVAQEVVSDFPKINFGFRIAYPFCSHKVTRKKPKTKNYVYPPYIYIIYIYPYIHFILFYIRRKKGFSGLICKSIYAKMLADPKKFEINRQKFLMFFVSRCYTSYLCRRKRRRQFFGKNLCLSDSVANISQFLLGSIYLGGVYEQS